MPWYCVALFVVLSGLMLVWALVVRRLPQPARMVVRLASFALFFGLSMGGVYIFTEYIVNKGPDDVGAMWHAGYSVAAKFGHDHEASCAVLAFDKDADGPESGTYRIRFRQGEHRGVIFCHYDKATHKFDRDNIEEKP